jgi:adenylosuccinate synthase
MKAFVTVGLGFGDEGKGSAVDYLVRRHRADLVVRYNGGNQAAHNVVLPDGTHHTFSHFGSGTFAGVKTYFGSQTIVNPVMMVEEAKCLANTIGTSAVDLVSSNMIFNTRALVASPWHVLMNRAKEVSRHSKHGSCGKGIGETRKYWLDHGSDAITVGDFHNLSLFDLRNKVETLRQRFLIDVQPYANANTYKYIEPMYRISPMKWVGEVKEILKYVTLSNSMPACNTAVFEGAQGILLDEYHGFHPHTTWSTCTSRHAMDELEGHPMCEVEVIGITRTYHTRHGAGPFPSEVKGYTVPESEHNGTNDWQTEFRMGAFDEQLFRYALLCEPLIDGLFVTCLDHCVAGGVNVCTEYRAAGGERVTPGLSTWSTWTYDLKHQEKVGCTLDNVQPVIEYKRMDEVFGQFDKPILYTSNGPTYQDKKDRT